MGIVATQPPASCPVKPGDHVFFKLPVLGKCDHVHVGVLCFP